MKNKITILTTLIFAGLAFSTPVLACKSAGPNKHVGVIVSINVLERILVLKDAETGEEMTFKAAEQLIKTVHPNQEAVITYETTDKGMIATKIKV